MYSQHGGDMGEIVLVVQSFGEYIFLGLMAVVLLAWLSAVPDPSWLRGEIARWLNPAAVSASVIVAPKPPGAGDTAAPATETKGDGTADTARLATETKGEGGTDTAAPATESKGDGRADTARLATETKGEGGTDTAAPATESRGDGRADTPASFGTNHAVLAGLIAVVGIWGMGVIFNGICYGTLEVTRLHGRFVAEAYEDAADSKHPRSSYEKLTKAYEDAADGKHPRSYYEELAVRDETTWRSQNSKAADEMLSRSRLRIVRGALVGAAIFLLVWSVKFVFGLFRREERKRDGNASRAALFLLRMAFCLACVALYYGYQALESQYHLAARYGAAEASLKSQAEADKLTAEKTRIESEAKRLTAAAEKLQAETVALKSAKGSPMAAPVTNH
jgi:hypothetical protein